MTTRQAAFVEQLLYATPEWSRWDRDLPALIERLKAFVDHIGDMPLGASRRHLQDPNRWEDALARARALWLLDRVLPAEAVDYFEGLLDVDTYDLVEQAWARRLGDRRDEMIARARDANLVASAWIETCEQAHPDELLRYYTLGQAREGGHPPYEEKVYEAYARRVADPFEGLLPWARLRLSRAASVLLRCAARALGPSEADLPEAEDAGEAWMRAELRPRFPALVEALEGRVGREWEYLEFWAWRHDGTCWEQLQFASSSLGDHLTGRVLAEIVPSDRIDAWAGLEEGAIQAFCRWLRPEYAAALLPWARHPEREVAQISWRCWLHDTPLPVLRALRADDLPRWQAIDLDRFLHAPAAVRFPRVGPTRQDYTWDPAVRDMFASMFGW